MLLSLVLTVLTAAGQSAAISPSSQARPDFSGEWVVVGSIANPGAARSAEPVLNPNGIYGEKFSAKQTAAMLSLELSVSVLPKPVLVVYALDGSESKNMNPVAGGEDEPIYSRAVWEGSRLVIDTRGTRLENGKPRTSRRIISFTADGLLEVQRLVEGEATTRSFYKRAK